MLDLRTASAVFIAGRLQPSPATLAGGLAFGSAAAGRRGTAWEALAACEAWAGGNFGRAGSKIEGGAGPSAGASSSTGTDSNPSSESELDSDFSCNS